MTPVMRFRTGLDDAQCWDRLLRVRRAMTFFIVTATWGTAWTISGVAHGQDWIFVGLHAAVATTAAWFAVDTWRWIKRGRGPGWTNR